MWVILSLLRAWAPTESVTVSSATASANVPVFAHLNSQAGSAELGDVAHNVESLTYTLDANKRLYLFRGDTDVGIDSLGSSIQVLEFPATTPGPLAPVTFPTLPGDKAWTSVRVYDVGECSMVLPWFAVASTVNAGLVTQLIDSHMFGDTISVRSGNLTSAGPVFAGTDLLRYDVEIHSNSVGGCLNPVIQFASTFSIVSVPETAVPEPRAPLDPLCGYRDSFSPATPPRQWQLRVASIRAHMDTTCVFGHDVESQLETLVPTGFSAAFGALVDSLTRFDFTELGQPPTGCTCAEDCLNVGMLGTGSRCDIGPLCEYRIDVQRILIRPEGLEIVIADPESNQLPLMPSVLTALAARPGSPIVGCAGGNRFPPAVTTPTLGTVRGVYSPVFP